MNVAERVLVCTDPEVSYNLCPGGKGGWRYVNDSLTHVMRSVRAANLLKGASAGGRARFLKMGMPHKFIEAAKHQGNAFLGRKHSEETKARMRANHSAKSHPRGPRGPYKKLKRANV